MNTKIFAQNFRAILQTKEITNAELSRRTGLTKSYITHILQAKAKNPSDATLNKIAKALDLTRDELLKLSLPETDPQSLLKKESRSIIVPFFFKFSSLKSEMFHSLHSMDLSGSPTFVSKTFISFPKCDPFLIMNSQRYISVLVDIDPGMSPKVEVADVVTINLNDTQPREKAIYLISIQDTLKFRYAKLQPIEDKKYIRFWAEDRGLSEDILPFDTVPFPILGNIRSHTRML